MTLTLKTCLLALMIWGFTLNNIFAATCDVQIISPQPGEQVRSKRQLKGNATIPIGNHLWVLTRIVGFKGYWPQGNGEANVDDGKDWVVLVFFGKPEELGEFEISTVVVDSQTDSDLRQWVKTAKDRGYEPLPLFPNSIAGCPIRKLLVQKIGD
jgi:hypothetical protein